MVEKFQPGRLKQPVSPLLGDGPQGPRPAVPHPRCSPAAGRPESSGSAWTRHIIAFGNPRALSSSLPSFLPRHLRYYHFCAKRAAKANTDSWRRLSGEQLREAGGPRPSGPPLCRHPRGPRAQKALLAASVCSGLSLAPEPISRARAPTAGSANPAQPASNPHSCEPPRHPRKY